MQNGGIKAAILKIEKSPHPFDRLFTLQNCFEGFDPRNVNRYPWDPQKALMFAK